MRRLLMPLVVASLPAAAVAEPAANLQAVAVTIQRMPAASWAGYGIYLGDGLLLTAAHVAGQGVLNHPRALVAGQPVDVEIVKEGSYPDHDLAVLRIAPPVPIALEGRRTTICADAPHPGEDVVVVTPEKVTTSAVIAPDILPPNLRAAYAASIKDVYTTGNSGSGVFDSASLCLLGIMSSKIEQHVRLLVNGAPTERTIGLAKHFVPSPDILAFLAGLPRP